MGIKKKHYFYDLEQFVDKNKKLLFLVKTIPLHPSGSIYILIDCHLNETAFNDLSELTPVELTFKKVIHKVCEHYDYGHRNAKGFSIKIRTEAIHLCLTLAYPGVAEEYKPTLQNIADIFGISVYNVSNMEKKFVNTDLLDKNYSAGFALLAQSVSCLYKKADNLAA